jgi:hypothetical protein
VTDALRPALNVPSISGNKLNTTTKPANEIANQKTKTDDDSRSQSNNNSNDAPQRINTKMNDIISTLLQSTSVHGDGFYMTDSNVALFIIKMMDILMTNITTKNETNADIHLIEDFLITLPAFWRIVDAQQHSLGTFGIAFWEMRVHHGNSTDVMYKMPEIVAFDILGLHYFLLKIATENNKSQTKNAELATLTDNLIVRIFREDRVIAHALTSATTLAAQVKAVEMFLPKKMLSIYQQWLHGKYTSEKAVEYYDLVFADIVTPIFRIKL